MKILTIENDKQDVMKMACDLCLKHNLYIQGRMAKGWMQQPHNMVKMCIAFQKKPIGWSMLYNSTTDGFFTDDPIIGVFVEPTWRNRKIGRTLIGEILKNTGPIYIDDRISMFRNCGALKKKKYEMGNSWEKSLNFKE